MINVFDKTRCVSYYDSIDEFVNHMDESESMRYGSADDDDSEFSGTKNLKEALDLCKYGDEELRKRVYDKSIALEDLETHTKVRHSTINDVVGFTPNVPNYIMGIPTNMIRDNRTMIKSKILNIYINLGVPWYVDKNDILDTAARYICAINQLENEGYRCNIYCGKSSESGNKQNLLAVKIKTDREPMNIAKMAFPMCHPSMLRRLGFKWMEIIPVDFGAGYGSSIGNKADMHMLLSKVFDKNYKFTILSVKNDLEKNIKDIVKEIKC